MCEVEEGAGFDAAEDQECVLERRLCCAEVKYPGKRKSLVEDRDKGYEEHGEHWLPPKSLFERFDGYAHTVHPHWSAAVHAGKVDPEGEAQLAREANRRNAQCPVPPFSVLRSLANCFCRQCASAAHDGGRPSEGIRPR
ncbi:hypothetical protein RvY_02656 [Ramazzottius varieornatus]|uniref:Uncharacterized protein n=1 Tax=Ramazzottius varieornatus TaxID=947166 RepID=A0A1D1UP92_RAMVA|nr:hypothetical protein RvY_02656 [Ramazzottius varieornatus]